MKVASPEGNSRFSLIVWRPVNTGFSLPFYLIAIESANGAANDVIDELGLINTQVAKAWFFSLASQ